MENAEVGNKEQENHWTQALSCSHCTFYYLAGMQTVFTWVLQSAMATWQLSPLQ